MSARRQRPRAGGAILTGKSRMPAGFDVEAYQVKVEEVAGVLFAVCASAEAEFDAGIILNAVATVYTNLGLENFGEASLAESLGEMLRTLPDFARQKRALLGEGGHA